MSLQSYTIEELGYFVTLCGAVGVSCVAIIIKSRCKTIDTPCVKCKREVLHEPTEKLPKTKSTDTENNQNTKLNEPSVEP